MQMQMQIQIDTDTDNPSPRLEEDSSIQRCIEGLQQLSCKELLQIKHNEVS